MNIKTYLRNLLPLNSEAARYSLALKEQVRLLNRAIQRRNRTIERLRARLASEQPTNLPELAKTKEGRALYNHAYNKGRIRGRRDVLDAMVKGASTGNPALDEAMEDTVTSAAYGQEHAH